MKTKTILLGLLTCALISCTKEEIEPIKVEEPEHIYEECVDIFKVSMYTIEEGVRVYHPVSLKGGVEPIEILEDGSILVGIEFGGRLALTSPQLDTIKGVDFFSVYGFEFSIHCPESDSIYIHDTENYVDKQWEAGYPINITPSNNAGVHGSWHAGFYHTEELKF